MTVPGRLEGQPFVEAKAAMSPNHNEKQALQSRARRPKPGEFVEVGVLDTEKDARDARVNDVREQKERDCDAQAKLRKLPGGKTQCGAHCEFVEAERDMGEKRQRQDRRARPGARDRPAPMLHIVHQFKTDETGGVIQKMGGGE